MVTLELDFLKAIGDYLKRKPGLKGQILDRGELKRVARPVDSALKRLDLN